MTVVRRELPRSRGASWRPESLSHSSLEDSPFDSRPISSMDQGGPQEAGELARDGGDDVLFGFASRGEALIAAVEAVLCRPRVGEGCGRGLLLPPP